MPVNYRPLVQSIALGVSALLLATNGALAKPGYYSVAEIKGIWWFVDPNGKAFYSLGVNDIRPESTPDTYDPQRPAYAAFRHYDSTEDWADHSIKRLQNWNFNTIGGWADPSLTNGPLPYAVVLHFGGGEYIPWNDILSPDFDSQIDQMARKLVAPHRTDRNLLGWFSDNELGWYPDMVFQHHLTQKTTSATRAKLIELLIEEYEHDFTSLNRDFDVSEATNFEELGRAGKVKLRPGGNGRKVILRFTEILAQRYYQVVHDAIRRYDPNHLILGDRYAWHCPTVVAKAAAPYVDVISTNLDWPEAKDGYLPIGYLRNLHRVTGKPVLVTEYYVAARENRSGNPNSRGVFLTVNSQADRVAAFRNRLRNLATQPYVVGAHWFRFADEPPHGRPKDGEDYNFGLVDIENRPYEVLTTAMTQLQSKIPQLHRESLAVNVAASELIAIPMLGVETGDLHAQLNNARSLGPQDDSLRLFDLLAAWSPKKLHIVAMVCDADQREMDANRIAATGHNLEITIASQDLDEPVRVDFGGPNGASSTTPGVECWISSKGLRHTLVVALPAERFGAAALAERNEIKLTLSLNDLLDTQAVEWEETFRLSLEGVADASSRRPQAADADDSRRTAAFPAESENDGDQPTAGRN
jgi:hypothetical protein